jgi:hypothetical protein
MLDQADSWRWDSVTYKPIPVDTGFCIAPADETRLWETLRALHNGLIEAAGQKWSQLRESSKKAHSPGVLQTLETLTGLNLPQPTFEIPELEDELERRLPEIPAFDPANLGEGKELTMANIVRRRGQFDFLRTLLKIYNGKSVISGCNVECALEAAHIIPYRGAQTNHPANGLFLRADLHILFDLGLITILTPEMSVRMDESLRGTEYEQYHGLLLPRPDEAFYNPNEEALSEHRRNRGFLRSTE